MNRRIKSRHVGVWRDTIIPPGETRDIKLDVSESYSGMTVHIPIHVQRAVEDGPVVFVTAAIHGDEINGTGTIRSLIQDESLKLIRGAVILVPVLNVLSFDRHTRYLPDRRDLNRCFPGSSRGSLASRMARVIFDEIVSRCDYGIDLHTAAVRRTNYPNVRGNMDLPEVAELARAFGSEVIVHSKGPKGAFRRECTAVGVPSIILEGGEVWKVEPTIVETALRGIHNVLGHLKMIEHVPTAPERQVVIRDARWVRAENSGFLQFHVKPGEVIREGQAIATNTNLLGREQNLLVAPFDGVIIGMATLPCVSPGEPVCHVGRLPKHTGPDDMERQRSDEQGLEGRTVEQLASNVLVVEHNPGEEP
ncbi:MAG: succinylglutamate desuccinylase/aspartoacylase family protein [Planctomycetaceae bacterium]